MNEWPDFSIVYLKRKLIKFVFQWYTIFLYRMKLSKVTALQTWNLKNPVNKRPKKEIAPKEFIDVIVFYFNPTICGPRLGNFFHQVMNPLDCPLLFRKLNQLTRLLLKYIECNAAMKRLLALCSLWLFEFQLIHAITFDTFIRYRNMVYHWNTNLISFLLRYRMPESNYSFKSY